ncbi:hypothetical protein RM53_10345 [Brevundimonas nasdae]|uniref:GIY-YIG domain-containing protein n=1 Tax=Brevundimonas nasdae TaxID=172043 RepID=A0A0B4DRT3_9CAUL|nr:GIY-YIG nuclease family protein [Brevundimonas nasdae]KIC56988.1 hypothetical protein RM53_10345 [Brevundimonas nasdae]
MAAPRHFKVADFSDEPEDTGHFCVATIDWSEPKPWDDDSHAPLGAAERDDALYVLVRDHWRASRKNSIVYVGMTTNLPSRFREHHCADRLRKMRGSTLLSIGNVRYSGRHGRWAAQNAGKALKQIEHILIWALPTPLENDKNQYSIPLLAGKNIADAKPWLIRREGHRFHGRMPREIVYPWMIVKPGRDRSLKL